MQLCGAAQRGGFGGRMSGTEFIPRADLAAALTARGRIVALLDAACLPGLPERLETYGPALSLFQGDAAKDLRDVSPYLVEMNDKLYRNFVNDKNVHWAMWCKRPGILLATDLSLEALRKHFRRFLRIETAGSVYFFRFWEAAATRAYFQALTTDERRDRWFLPREGGVISAFLIPDTTADGVWIERAADLCAAPPVNRPFTLSNAEFGAIQGARQQEDLAAMVALMAATFPDLAQAMPPADLERGVLRSVGRAWEFGIKQRENAFQIAAWDAHTSGHFEAIDPAGQLRALLEAQINETDKMRRLEDRIAALETVDPAPADG